MKVSILGPESANGQMIGLALEGKIHAKNTAIIEDNLFIFDIELPWIGRR